MIINLVNNTNSNYINIIFTEPNIISVNNISHTITINQVTSLLSSSAYKSEITISDSIETPLRITP